VFLWHVLYRSLERVPSRKHCECVCLLYVFWRTRYLWARKRTGLLAFCYRLQQHTGLLHSFLALYIRSPAAFGQAACVRLVARFFLVMSILLGGGCSPSWRRHRRCGSAAKPSDCWVSCRSTFAMGCREGCPWRPQICPTPVTSHIFLYNNLIPTVCKERLLTLVLFWWTIIPTRWRLK
jgi:hypothetical protein